MDLQRVSLMHTMTQPLIRESIKQKHGDEAYRQFLYLVFKGYWSGTDFHMFEELLEILEEYSLECENDMEDIEVDDGEDFHWRYSISLRF